MRKKTIGKKPKVIVTFRTPYRAQLEEIALKEHRTVSNIVQLAVEEFLARNKASTEFGIHFESQRDHRLRMGF